MDIRQRIRDAQAKIIRNLMTCESLISELYGEFACADPELSKFWLDIADEEKDHAKHLEALLQLLDKGVIFHHLGRFDEVAIAPLMNLVSTELAAARRTSPTRHHALQVAVKIEMSVFDAHFYETVVADSPEFRTVAAKLSSDTRKHAELLREMCLKYPAKPG